MSSKFLQTLTQHEIYKKQLLKLHILKKGLKDEHIKTEQIRNEIKERKQKYEQLCIEIRRKNQMNESLNVDIRQVMEEIVEVREKKKGLMMELLGLESDNQSGVSYKTVQTAEI